MISSARECLRHLELNRLYPQYHLLPQFPKLSFLLQSEDRFSCPAPKTRHFRIQNFPALKTLYMQFPWINWEGFPPASEMAKMELSKVRTPSKSKVGNFLLLLNADVAHLTLNFDEGNISNLLKSLKLLNMEDRDDSKTKTKIVFYGLEEPTWKKPSKKRQIQIFAAILDKLCKRWSRVEFHWFEVIAEIYIKSFGC
jgi:hypothetical protein